MKHSGVLLIRVEDNDFKISAIVNTIMENYEILKNNFSVIKNETLRIRG